MTKIGCIIIDDENPARALVKAFIAKKGNFEVLAEAGNGFDAVKMIDELKPDLIFLDIQMPKLTGFEVLELIHHHPKVIFTTAYDQFAVKAFEENAVDYLLKPFSFSRFSKALDRVTEPRVNESNYIIEKINRSSELKRVVVKEGNSINVIKLSEIKYLQANDDYVIIKSGGKEYVKHQTMNFYENTLPSDMFIRIHRSTIINIQEIKKLIHIAKENYEIELQDGDRLRVSKSNIKKVKELINL
ncbi:MAG: response regulator [Bacteroidota bacterium]